MTTKADYRAGRLDWLVSQADLLDHTITLATGGFLSSGNGTPVTIDPDEWTASIYASRDDAAAGEASLVDCEVTSPDPGYLRMALNATDLPDVLLAPNVEPYWGLVKFKGTANQRTYLGARFQVDAGVLAL